MRHCLIIRTRRKLLRERRACQVHVSKMGQLRLKLVSIDQIKGVRYCESIPRTSKSRQTIFRSDTLFLPIHRASKYNDKWRGGGWATVEKSEPSKFGGSQNIHITLTILLEGRIAYPVQDYHNECKRNATHALKLTSSYRPIFFAPRRLRPSQSTPAVIPLPQLVTTGLSPEIIFSAYCAPTTLSSAARSSCSGRKVVYSPLGVP